MWLGTLKQRARTAVEGLFDQETAFGRLALVQVAMVAGDTLVTISLAKTVFFTDDPGAAKGKVLLYLLLTVAPFAVVSPLLGPLIDASRGARRLVVFTAAAGRVVLCVMMASSVHSLLLYPLAFCQLVLSKLYLVTRGALVPEMAALDQVKSHERGEGEEPRWVEPDAHPDVGEGYATFNAQLTLLGTLAGFVISLPGIALLQLTHAAPAVLVFAALAFTAAAACAMRLRMMPARVRGRVPSLSDEEAEQIDFKPIDEREVIYGLTASATVRLTAGFLTFLIAFGLRRSHAGLYWYGFAFAGSGIGSLAGLWLVRRLRQRLSEQWLLAAALALLAAGAGMAALLGTIFAQVVLALVAGVAGAIAQPSFDALTQRHVPPAAQGRVFARLAVRQQLAWVVGALIPVAIPMPFRVGDVLEALIAVACLIGYVGGRTASTWRSA